jgi:aminoglycoside phosphotransferase family enzyme
MSTIETPVDGGAIAGLAIPRKSAAEVIETAYSWVFLTERHAYKVKKPLDLGEANLRTAAGRRKACLDEVWLNQRLAPGVYRGVVPISRDPRGGLALNGKGDVVEWAVKMRRLPEELNLARLLDAGGEILTGQISALAQVLAKFYRDRAPQTEVLDRLTARLQSRVLSSSMQLRRLLPDSYRRRARRLRDAQLEYLAGARAVLNLRVCDGRIVDGHGDLRPEHVFLERQPAVIDCLDTSAALRRIDVLDDLGLLTMECERRQREDIAAAVMAAYAQLSGDDGFPHLEAFYKSLHACERAAATAREAREAREARPAAPEKCPIAPQQAIEYLIHAEAYVQSLT